MSDGRTDRRSLFANGVAALAAGSASALASSGHAGAADGRRMRPSRPEVITFDVYGTLSQWDQTLEAALREIFQGRAAPRATCRLRRTPATRRLLRLEAVGAFRSYRLILRDALRPAMATAGLTRAGADGGPRIERLRRVRPFPEVPSGPLGFGSKRQASADLQQ